MQATECGKEFETNCKATGSIVPKPGLLMDTGRRHNSRQGAFVKNDDPRNFDLENYYMQSFMVTGVHSCEQSAEHQKSVDQLCLFTDFA